MEIFINILIIVLFLIEAFVLFKMETSLWKTVYTPLNCLMIPYVIVLIFTICLPDSIGFVDFYYPSILFWMIGLPIFFIPSLCFGIWFNKHNFESSKQVILDIPDKKPMLYLTLFLLILFSFQLIFVQGRTVSVIGSDEFADEFSSHGIFGHVFVLLIALVILWIFLFNKSNLWWSLPIILGVIAIAIINQSKSMVIIPIFTSLLMRIKAKKLRLKLKTVLIACLSGFAVFFLSYYLLIIVVEDSTLTMEFVEAINIHFIHYLTSGVNGLSIDMQVGFIENPDLRIIFSPFVNIVNVLTGQDIIYSLNRHYLDAGHALTNIRTFFGTIYIYGREYSILIILFFSLLIYFIRVISLRKQSIYLLAIDSWFCVLLFMGWFDFYFHLLVSIEVPILIFLIAGFNKFFNLFLKRKIL